MSSKQERAEKAVADAHRRIDMIERGELPAHLLPIAYRNAIGAERFLVTVYPGDDARGLLARLGAICTALRAADYALTATLAAAYALEVPNPAELHRLGRLASALQDWHDGEIVGAELLETVISCMAPSVADIEWNLEQLPSDEDRESFAEWAYRRVTCREEDLFTIVGGSFGPGYVAPKPPPRDPMFLEALREWVGEHVRTCSIVVDDKPQVIIIGSKTWATAAHEAWLMAGNDGPCPPCDLRRDNGLALPPGCSMTESVIEPGERLLFTLR